MLLLFVPPYFRHFLVLTLGPTILYLDEHEARRLAEVAKRECRRPTDQLRWILRQTLGIANEQQMPPLEETKSDAGLVLADTGIAR